VLFDGGGGAFDQPNFEYWIEEHMVYHFKDRDEPIPEEHFAIAENELKNIGFPNDILLERWFYDHDEELIELTPYADDIVNAYAC